VAQFPSLDLVAREVDRQLETQLRYFEWIDTKAGVILGFSGAFVALTFRISGSLIEVAGILAALSGTSALSAFWPRRNPILDLQQLRDRYLMAQTSFTAIHLLDTRIEMERRAAQTLRSKLLRLGASVYLLLGAIGVSVAGMILR
jgi:hypothetical protein